MRNKEGEYFQMCTIFFKKLQGSGILGQRAVWKTSNGNINVGKEFQIPNAHTQ